MFQKGKIAGLCGVTRWNEVPKIWNKIEAYKTDRDLCAVLMKGGGLEKGPKPGILTAPHRPH